MRQQNPPQDFIERAKDIEQYLGAKAIGSIYGVASVFYCSLVWVIFAVLVGWLGGAFVSYANNRIEIPFAAFYSALRDVVEIKDVANGVFKSFIFALIIAVVSCHQGLVTRGGPRGIGRSVTKAVVNSIVLIVISDYVLTRLLLS